MSQTANPYGFSAVNAKVSNTATGYSAAQYPIRSGYTAAGIGTITTPLLGIGSGDPVAFQAPAITTATGGIGLMTTAAGGLSTTGVLVPAATAIPMIGIFTGCTYRNNSGQTNPQYFQAWINGTAPLNAANAQAYVEDMPFTVFQVQCNGSLATWATNAGNGGGAQAAIGQNFSFQYGPLNIATGQSTAALDVTAAANNGSVPITQATSAFAPFKIIGVATISGNSINDPYPDVLVVPNLHFFKGGSASIQA